MSISSPNSSGRGVGTLGVMQVVSDAFNAAVRSYFGIFFLNLPILIVSVAVLGSTFTPFLSQDRAAMEQVIQENMGRFVFFETMAFVLGILLSCAMTQLIHDRYLNIRRSGYASAAAGARRALPVFGLLLIVTLAYFVFAFALALAFAFLQFIFGSLTIVLAIGLSIFGLYLAFPYLLAGIVCISEGLGPLKSLQRSKYLTDAYRWPLLALVAAAIAIMAVYQVIFLAMGLALAPTAYGQTLMLVFIALFYPLLGGWLIGLFVIATHRLRVLKDGVMPSQTMSNIFD